jgi:hypothetical protein
LDLRRFSVWRFFWGFFFRCACSLFVPRHVWACRRLGASMPRSGFVPAQFLPSFFSPVFLCSCAWGRRVLMMGRRGARRVAF